MVNEGFLCSPPPSDRAAITREARQKFEPVMILWSDFGEQWPVRATAAAAWLADASSVTDLGCGTMSLERYLRPEQRYVPVDLLPRDERTLVLDLNKSLDIERLPASVPAKNNRFEELPPRARY